MVQLPSNIITRLSFDVCGVCALICSPCSVSHMQPPVVSIGHPTNRTIYGALYGAAIDLLKLDVVLVYMLCDMTL